MVLAALQDKWQADSKQGSLATGRESFTTLVRTETQPVQELESYQCGSPFAEFVPEE